MLHDSGHSAYPEKLKHNTIYIPNHKQFYRFLNNLLSDWNEIGNPVFKPEPVAIELLEDKEEEKKVVPATTFYQLENEFPEEEFLPIDAIANEWLSRKKQKEERKDSLIDKFIQEEPSIPRSRRKTRVHQSSQSLSRMKKPNFSRKLWQKYTSANNYMTRPLQLI